MQKDIVVFKNTIECFNIILRPEPSFKDIMIRIEEKIVSNRDFYKGSSLSLKYLGRKLTLDEERQIVSIFTTLASANVTDILPEKEEAIDEGNSINQIDSVSSSRVSKNYNELEEKVVQAISYSDEGMTKFHKGTLRSGQYIGYRGNVVLFGDMNPGSEIVATGNIIVLGTIRGIVRAGVEGDTESVVAALGLSPILLSIGDVISRSPEEEKSKKVNVKVLKLEIAYLKDNVIYIGT